MLLFHVLKQRPARVLFICLDNSYRSKFAETFANTCGSDIVEVGSAGFMPARYPSQTARRLMREKGLPLSDVAPRHWNEAEFSGWDLIVNMCELGLPRTSVPILNIPFADPVGRPEAERREIRDQIEVMVQVMLAQFRQARDEWPWNILGAYEELTVSWWTQHPATAQSLREGLPV